MRRLCLLYKILSTKTPSYIYDFIPSMRQFQTHPNTFNSFSCETEYFKSSIFPLFISKWDKLDSDIRGSSIELCSISCYWSLLGQVKIKFVILNIQLVSNYQLSCSYVLAMPGKTSSDTLNALYFCSIEAESTSRFCLHCHLFLDLRVTLIKHLRNIDSDLSSLSDHNLTVIRGMMIKRIKSIWCTP